MDKKKNFWKKRTTVEKCLMLVVIFALVVIIFLTVKLHLKKPMGETVKTENVCTTEKCIRSAASILEKIDRKVQPCEDFYRFACGNFIKQTSIPAEKTSISSFSKLADEVTYQLNKIYEAPLSNNDQKPSRLLKTIYKSCMNITRIEKEALEHFKKLFKNLGGWPVLDQNQWTEKNFDWKKLLYSMRRIGLKKNVFFTLYIGADMKNTTKRTIGITQPSMPYERLRKGFNHTSVKAYYEYMVNVATLFGAEKLRAIGDMREVLGFEISMAKIVKPWESRLNNSDEYNLMTIRELQRKYPSIPWLQYINTYLAPMEMVNSDEVVNLALPEVLIEIENLLLKTSKRILANYIFWTVVEDSILYLPENIRNEYLDYSKVVYGTTAPTPRWKECVSAANRLTVAASAVYIRTHFDSNSRRKVAELVTDIKGVFYETLHKIGWMDRKTKKHALAKAEKMGYNIGYYDQLMDDDKVNGYYESLELNSDEFHLDLVLNISQFSYMHYVKRLREPIVKPDWRESSYAFVVNAFYSWHENDIELPAAVLQDPFFDSGRPQYMNYGSIGEIIGHEITHGFDDTGRQYDKDGNLVDWWTPETNKTFARKAQCLVEQYGNYTIPDIDMNLNGIKTLGENIADNGGIKIAYRGYQKWVERNSPEQTLPGLPYTAQQLFWISSATSWCTKYKKEYLKTMVESGFHAPIYFRVLVPYMNSDYFAKDFKCPLGSPMNPKYKCRVW